MAAGFRQPTAEQRDAQQAEHRPRVELGFCDGCGVRFRPA